MDPISNADRLVLLLRLKLEERAKSNAANRSAGKPQADAPASPLGVRALATIDWSDERPMRRAIIQSLLADQLGPELVNDAQFQQIVTRVSDAIEDDAGASELLTKVVAELRRS
jgi:hypothetical protein